MMADPIEDDPEEDESEVERRSIFGVVLDKANVKTICNPPSEIRRNDPCPCGSGKKAKHCVCVRFH